MVTSPRSAQALPIVASLPAWLHCMLTSKAAAFVWFSFAASIAVTLRPAPAMSWVNQGLMFSLNTCRKSMAGRQQVAACRGAALGCKRGARFAAQRIHRTYTHTAVTKAFTQPSNFSELVYTPPHGSTHHPQQRNEVVNVVGHERRLELRPKGLHPVNEAASPGHNQEAEQAHLLLVPALDGGVVAVGNGRQVNVSGTGLYTIKGGAEQHLSSKLLLMQGGCGKRFHVQAADHPSGHEPLPPLQHFAGPLRERAGCRHKPVRFRPSLHRRDKACPRQL